MVANVFCVFIFSLLQLLGYSMWLIVNMAQVPPIMQSYGIFFARFIICLVKKKKKLIQLLNVMAYIYNLHKLQFHSFDGAGLIIATVDT